MSISQHQKYEKEHVEASENVRDFVIGMADGLTVPFALISGLSGVVEAVDIIIAAGVAEITAGMIAMGLGGHLAAKTDRQHYETELMREEREIIEFPEIEKQEVASILEDFGLEKQFVPSVLQAFENNPEKWRDFMMRFELGLQKPASNREFISPLAIGSAYALGGIIPLSPYFFANSVEQALPVSIAVTSIALLSFGAFKGYYTGISKVKSALQTWLIGGIAAFTAYFTASLF